MRKAIVAGLGVCLIGWLGFQIQSHPAAGTTCLAKDSVLAKENPANPAAGFVPLPFVTNEGQFPPTVAYCAMTTSGPVAVNHNGDILYADRGRRAGAGRTPLQEHFACGLPVCVESAATAPTRVNYFLGNDPHSWHRDVPTHRRVTLGEVYPGISVDLLAKDHTVEKIFSLAPGADPAAIRVGFSGSSGLSTTPTGELRVEAESGEFLFSRPLAYQEQAGQIQYVDVEYRITEDEYGFAVGEYDPTRMLTIDPQLTSTFVGGSAAEGAGIGYSILALGDDGTVFIAGSTNSTDWPATSGAYDNTANGGLDFAVAKLDPDLSTVLTCTFVGGSGDDGHNYGLIFDLDTDGNLWVAGHTASSDFPTTPGAFDASYNGGIDIAVFKLDNDLTTLLGSTYLGGTSLEINFGLDTDADGNGFVCGFTNSQTGNFPTTPGAYDETYNGHSGSPYGGDFYISKLSNDMTTLLASTFLGGSAGEDGGVLVIGGDGNVYFTGITGSSNYPVTEGAYDETYNGREVYGDATVSILSNDLSTLLASTFLGGPADDWSEAIMLDSEGNVYIVGTVTGEFPTTPGAFEEEYTGIGGADAGNDGFICKLSADLSSLLASTYYGGTAHEVALGLDLDSVGNVIIGGATKSADMPMANCAYDCAMNSPGIHDGFVAKFDADLTSLLASTYLGGSAEDRVYGVRARDNHVYIFGRTSSANFPTTAGVVDMTFNGITDFFVTRLNIDWALGDDDGDAVANGDDNCPQAPNPGQEDTDLDGLGDPCDNCSSIYNPGQEDINGNGIGDSCEVPQSLHVDPEGGGDAQTIQDAIDLSSNGDTIVVAPGIYSPVASSGFDFGGRTGIVLQSENGAGVTIIDCQGSESAPRRAFTFANDEDSTFIIDGFTIRGGYGEYFSGGASGGGILINNCAPTIQNCVFTDNSATYGGAVYAYRKPVRLTNCTFAGNSAPYGAAVLAYVQVVIELDNCVVAFNQGGQPVYCLLSSSAALTCCDVYCNVGGDWVGAIAGQNGTNGNISADPQFCNVAIGDVGLQDETSPCLPENNSCGVLMGALGFGCACDCGVVLGDVTGDAALNPVDVAFMVNYVYKQRDARVPLPNCPFNPGDVDCNNQVNPVDVAYYVNAVYKSLNAFCDPCG